MNPTILNILKEIKQTLEEIETIGAQTQANMSNSFVNKLLNLSQIISARVRNFVKRISQS